MSAADQLDEGERGRSGPGPIRVLLAALLAVLLLIGLDLGLRGPFPGPAGPALLAQLAGFACVLALLLSPLVWLSDLGLRRRSTSGLVLAAVCWLPLIWYLAQVSFEGGQARRFAAGGFGPLLASLLAGLALFTALGFFSRLRRRRPLLASLTALALAAILHALDRRLYIGLYPIQHAICGFFAFAAAAFAFLVPRSPGGPSKLRFAFAAFLLIVVGAGVHLWTLHQAPMALRALVLANDGLVTTREFDRFLPYRRPGSRRPPSTELSTRHLEEQARRARARSRLAELRPEETLDVIILSIDALRADHTSLENFERDTTPFLAEFAKECLYFEDARSPSTASFFSISSMLSGAYPSTVSLLKGRDPEFLGEALGRRGFATIGYYTDAVFTARPREWVAPDQRLGFANFRIATEESVEMIPLLLEQIDRQTGPYLLFSHFMDPHFSYEIHEGFDFGEKAVDRYHSELAFVDSQVRRFVAELRDRGRLKRTILVITSDHGEAFGEHGALLHGGVPYEEQCRVPLLIHVPFLGGGQRIPGPVSLTSLAPTLVDLLGLPDLRDSEARSLTPMIFEDIDPETVFALVERPTLFDRATWPSTTALIKGRWKLLHDHDAAVAQLFDLVTDPGERVDRGADSPEVLNELLDLEESWRSDRRLLAARDAGLPLDLLTYRDRLREGDAEALAEVARHLDSDSALVRREAGLAVYDAILAGQGEPVVLSSAASRQDDAVLTGLSDLLRAGREARPWRAGAALLSADHLGLRRRAAAALWEMREAAWAAQLATTRFESEEDAEVRADLLGVQLAERADEPTLVAAIDLIPDLEGDVVSRLVYSIMALDDAILDPHFDRLIRSPDARVTMSVIESLGARDSERRRETIRRFLRLRNVTLKRIAVFGLRNFPRSDWKRDILIEMVLHEPHNEVRILAGIELAQFKDPEVGRAYLEALAVHPVTGLGFGHLMATTRPGELAAWELRESEVEGDLASGTTLSLMPDFNRPWGRRMRRILITSLRDPALAEKGDLIRVHDAKGQLVFEKRHLTQAAMYFVDLPLHGAKALQPPFTVSVVAEQREPGAIFGKIYATLIPFRDPIQLWPADFERPEAVGILSRFGPGWSCSLDHLDRVFLTAAKGSLRMIAPGEGVRALEVDVVGGRRGGELELLLRGNSLGRFSLAAGAERTLRIDDLGEAFDPRGRQVLEFRASDLEGSFDPVLEPEAGLALRRVSWR